MKTLCRQSDASRQGGSGRPPARKIDDENAAESMLPDAAPPRAQQQTMAAAEGLQDDAACSFPLPASEQGRSKRIRTSPALSAPTAARTGKKMSRYPCPEADASLFSVEGKVTLPLIFVSNLWSTMSKSSSTPSCRAPPADLGHHSSTGMTPNRDTTRTLKPKQILTQQTKVLLYKRGRHPTPSLHQPAKTPAARAAGNEDHRRTLKPCSSRLSQTVQIR